ATGPRGRRRRRSRGRRGGGGGRMGYAWQRLLREWVGHGSQYKCRGRAVPDAGRGWIRFRSLRSRGWGLANDRERSRTWGTNLSHRAALAFGRRVADVCIAHLFARPPEVTMSAPVPLEVRTLPLADLTPAPYNPRRVLRPTDPRYRKLAASLREFG